MSIVTQCISRFRVFGTEPTNKVADETQFPKKGGFHVQLAVLGWPSDEIGRRSGLKIRSLWRTGSIPVSATRVNRYIPLRPDFSGLFSC